MWAVYCFAYRAFDAIWEVELLAPDITATENIDIVFVIDSSGSMVDNDRYGLRKSETKKFIDILDEKDRGAIIYFDYYARLYQGLTEDKETLKKAVDRIDSSGGTNVYAVLDLALEQFAWAPQGFRVMEELYYDDSPVVLEGNIPIIEEYGENGLEEATTEGAVKEGLWSQFVVSINQHTTQIPEC